MIFYGQQSRQTAAEARGYDPHVDDLLPPAAHLQAADGVDVAAAFAAETRAFRFVGELSRCTHPHCRTSLTEDTVIYCGHDRPFCENCRWTEGCEPCDTEAWDALIDQRDAS